jgi:TPR repeat protein
MIKLLKTAAFLLFTAVSAPAMAQDFDNGVEAYQAGDYETALQGNAKSQNNLGYLYRNGNGVSQDYAEAAEWYRLAAVQGYAEAQNNLGNLFNNGNGVIQDYAEAAMWYRKAAVQGHALAQSNLGAAYAKGHGVIQDAVLAHSWFNISSANGDTVSSEYRGIIEQDMTREQIGEAQALARRCIASDYQDCG